MCTSSCQEVQRAEASGVQGNLWLRSEFEGSLGYQRLFPKNRKRWGKEEKENTTERVRENTTYLVPFIVRQNVYSLNKNCRASNRNH